MSFTALYRGWCSACDSDIKPGEEIERLPGDDGEYVHVKCPEAELDKPLTGERCPRCTTYHPGEC